MAMRGKQGGENRQSHRCTQLDRHQTPINRGDKRISFTREDNIELNVLASDILPAAIGVAANAFAVIAVIIVLLTGEGGLNGIMFLVGWIGGLAFVIAVVHTLVDLANTLTDANPSVVVAQALLGMALGVVLLGMGFTQWRKRPKGGEPEPLPKWLTSIDAKVSEGNVITPNRSTALAFTLAALNPKAIALVLVASVAVAKTAPTFVDTILDFATFIGIASIAVAVPVVYRVRGGENAEATLVRWKDWVIHRRAEVTAGVLFFLGILFIAKGLASLMA